MGVTLYTDENRTNKRMIEMDYQELIENQDFSSPEKIADCIEGGGKGWIGRLNG